MCAALLTNIRSVIRLLSAIKDRYFREAVDLLRRNGVRDATGDLARFLAPFFGVLPDLSVARDDAHETHRTRPISATGQRIWLSMIVILIGAKLNAETEHQTARESTVGEPKPLGWRGTKMADTVGPAR
jgi:hypothetical protein